MAGRAGESPNTAQLLPPGPHRAATNPSESHGAARVEPQKAEGTCAGDLLQPLCSSRATKA